MTENKTTKTGKAIMGAGQKIMGAGCLITIGMFLCIILAALVL